MVEELLKLDLLKLPGSSPSLGTISVIYLIFLVTLKAFRLGFHLEFHWFDSSQYFLPGTPVSLMTRCELDDLRSAVTETPQHS